MRLKKSKNSLKSCTDSLLIHFKKKLFIKNKLGAQMQAKYSPPYNTLISKRPVLKAHDLFNRLKGVI